MEQQDKREESRNTLPGTFNGSEGTKSKGGVGEEGMGRMLLEKMSDG